jgi:RNA polymerase-binding protein DksA
VAKKGKDNNDKQVKKPARSADPKATKEVKGAAKPADSRKSASQAKPEPVKTLTNLTPKELAHFQRLLLAKRAELVGDVNSMEDEALQKSRLNASGDLSTMPIHMADIGTANYEQEFALGLLDGERKLLREINDALLRIQERTYGICEGTGNEISKARLEANPWARYCVEYARMLEKGLVKEGEKVSKGSDEEDVIDDEDIIDDEELSEEPDEEEEETETPEEEPLAPEDEELGEDGLDWRESKNN